jgi:threonylcarbamoyladenosine tRNA methylthiotransferase MtaB
MQRLVLKHRVTKGHRADDKQTEALRKGQICSNFVCQNNEMDQENSILSGAQSSLRASGSTLRGKKAAYHTLGCKLNFAETATLSDLLQQEGVERAQEGEPADICIVNTCSVTETSDHKCRQAIHKMVRENPGALMVVTGCYAQLSAKAIAAIPGVDLVVGMEQKGHIVEYIKEKMPEHLASLRQDNGASLHEAYAVPLARIHTFVPSCSRGERTRYFLKVQDGCNYFCTYCTIPIARGRSRNATIAETVAQARKVAQQGGKEIVITGVNIGDFGRSTGETFFDLVKALDEVESIERYRISSIEPNLLTNEIVDYCAHSRAFMPHFHIPLQSGSDEVLRLMHRRYDTRFFADKIGYIKAAMPDAFIGVDVIVGTRGETDELFEKAFDYARRLDVSQYHVFSYSERPGTAALRIPYKVADAVKHERSRRLIALSEEKRQAFYARYTGTVRPVLAEHARRGQPIRGFTDNYIRVELPETDSIHADNCIMQVRLGGFNADRSALVGTIISQ